MSEPMSDERLAKLFADMRGEDGLSLNEIDAIESEVERLRGKLAKAEEHRDAYARSIDIFVDIQKRTNAELAAVREDAERFRWLMRMNNEPQYGRWSAYIHTSEHTEEGEISGVWTPEKVLAAIDAARKESQ